MLSEQSSTDQPIWSIPAHIANGNKSGTYSFTGFPIFYTHTHFPDPLGCRSVRSLRSRNNLLRLLHMSYNSGAEYYTPLRTEDSEDRHRTKSIPYGGSLDFTPAGPHSYTCTYRYGPPGLVGLLQNKYTLVCALFASIGGLTFGYDQGVIANVLVMKDFLERWPDVGPWEKGLMSTCCVRLRKPYLESVLIGITVPVNSCRRRNSRSVGVVRPRRVADLRRAYGKVF
jgi:hypothetical protein